jgi:hypothetical protein
MTAHILKVGLRTNGLGSRAGHVCHGVAHPQRPILRSHHFMQNLLAQAEYIIKDGAIYSPSGDGKMPYVDARDVAAIGKKLRFVDESPEQAQARRIREGVPPTVIKSILLIGAYQRAGGKTVTVTNTIADLTGRPPRTVAEFVQEHVSAFRG